MQTLIANTSQRSLRTIVTVEVGRFALGYSLIWSKLMGTKSHKFSHFFVYFLFAIFLMMYLTPSACLASESPSTYIDVAGTTADAGNAFDNDEDSYATISTSIDAYPSIIFLWDISSDEYIQYKLEGFSVELIEPEPPGDDIWEIQYSVDGGGNWFNLPVTENQSNVDVPEVTIQNLRLRVNTDKIRKGDGNFLQIYDINAQVAETVVEPPSEPIIYQGAFGLYEGVSIEEFYSITESISGDSRAQAIAIDSSYMYVAGEVPLGTVRGWRIEKRNLNDGELSEVATAANGGEPHAIVIDGSTIFIVGDAYSDGKYRWYIEKRYRDDLSLVPNFGQDGIIQVDLSDFSGKAYAAVIADESLIIAGSDYSEGNARWHIEKRDLISGYCEISITSDLGSGDHIPYTMATDTDGSYLYIGGYQTEIIGKNKKAITTVRPRIEKRSLADLLLITEANDGFTSETFATITALAYDAGYLYAAGTYELGFFDTAWVIEKYDAAELTSLWSFEEDYGWDDRPLALAVHSGRLIAAGFSADFGYGGDTAWRINFYTLEEGDPAFPYSVLHDINSQKNDRAFAMAIDTDCMYIAGYENSGIPRWHIQKRSAIDGSLGALSLLDPYILAGTPLGVTTVAKNTHFRCKVLLNVVDDIPLMMSEGVFKLQYCSGGCSSDGYEDVTSESPIAFAKMGWHGMEAEPETSDENDPFIGDPAILYQTVVEENNFTNSISQIDPGESGLWDFSLKGNAPGTYCLRIVMVDDENPQAYKELDGYEPIEITISD